MIVSLQPHPIPPGPPAVLDQVAGHLDGEAVGRIVAASTDLSLVIDADGVIRDASIGTDLEAENIPGWLGRRWVDTVTVESRPKVDALLRDARPEGITRWRQVNHPSPSGIDLPIRYASIRPAKGGPILVLGRDMRAVAGLQRRLMETQQALERDYERLRAVETRYRLLFQISGEPVLVVDAGTRRVAEANPAAARLLGRPAKRVAGQDVVDLFDAGSTRALEAQFAALRATGQAGEIRAALPHGRGEVSISVSLFRGEGGASALMRLVADTATAEAGAGQEVPTQTVIEAMPEGFVVTDPSRRILTANAAFLELASSPPRGRSAGAPWTIGSAATRARRRPCSRRSPITARCGASRRSSAVPMAAWRTWRSRPSRCRAPAPAWASRSARPRAGSPRADSSAGGKCRARWSRWPNWSAGSR